MATELIRDYLPDQAAAWDDLVARAVNGTMLHTRRYLSYHGDRFRDRSLLITNSPRLAHRGPAGRRGPG